MVSTKTSLARTRERAGGAAYLPTSRSPGDQCPFITNHDFVHATRLEPSIRLGRLDLSIWAPGWLTPASATHLVAFAVLHSSLNSSGDVEDHRADAPGAP
jgi:hypothetical protein